MRETVILRVPMEVFFVSFWSPLFFIYLFIALYDVFHCRGVVVFMMNFSALLNFIYLI